MTRHNAPLAAAAAAVLALALPAAWPTAAQPLAVSLLASWETPAPARVPQAARTQPAPQRTPTGAGKPAEEPSSSHAQHVEAAQRAADREAQLLRTQREEAERRRSQQERLRSDDGPPQQGTQGALSIS